MAAAVRVNLRSWGRESPAFVSSLQHNPHSLGRIIHLNMVALRAGLGDDPAGL